MSQPDLGFQPTKTYIPKGKLEFTIPKLNIEKPWWDFFNSNPTTGTTAITPTPVVPISTINTAKTTIPPKVPNSMWSGKNIGGTMQGIGAVASAIGNMMAVHETKKYNKKILDMEEKRLAKANKKADEQNAEYESVWG